jgi:hypothetical protein
MVEVRNMEGADTRAGQRDQGRSADAPHAGAAPHGTARVQTRVASSSALTTPPSYDSETDQPRTEQRNRSRFRNRGDEGEVTAAAADIEEGGACITLGQGRDGICCAEVANLQLQSGHRCHKECAFVGDARCSARQSAALSEAQVRIRGR